MIYESRIPDAPKEIKQRMIIAVANSAILAGPR